ncbi:hypothetical protein [Amorphus sp. 3PC139-8]|uniref:hypothetical protein n=1 Tax=Amorphus sp. 3PC139-8 TaxID=2735676 RepID=UPI00345CD88A
MSDANLGTQWAHVRATRYSKTPPPEDWPSGVMPISLEGLSLLGLDPKTNRLYWDGKELQIKRRLDWPERILAAIVALSGLTLAVIEIGRVAKWWT